VRERERHDPLLDVRADLVGHPRPAALADVQGLKTPAIDLALEAVVRRAVDRHQPARLADVAQLLGQREQPQAVAAEHVMLCHQRCSPFVSWRTEGSLSRRADAPASWPGRPNIKTSLHAELSQQPGVSPS